MGLIGEVQAAMDQSRPGLPCVVVRVRKELKGQDLKDFEALLADETVFATALTRALRNRGFQVARAAIQRHRGGECGCPRG